MDGKMSNSYLKSMVGKDVKAYQGGPESATGRLINVGSNFIILENERDGVIYYQTQHIKSIVENSKTNMLLSFSESDNDIADGENFQELLTELVGSKVKINRGGPESRTGTLLSVTADYLVVLTEKDGIVYYNIEHIKSVSISNKGNASEAEEDDDHDQHDHDKKNDHDEANADEQHDFINVDGLDRLFEKMQYSLVTINRGGPESVEGVLVDTSDQLLTLVVREEVVRISKYHVKSISQRISNSNAQENNNSNNNSNNSSNKNSSKDDGDSLVAIKKKNREKRRKR